MNDVEGAWLDTADGRGGSEISLTAARPVAIVEQMPGQRASIRVAGRLVGRDARIWSLIETLWDCCRFRTPGVAPITPGLVGYLGFEAADQLERLPAPPTQTPLALPIARLALYDRAIVLDHVARQAYAVYASHVAGALQAAFGVRPPADAEWLARWEQAAQLPATAVSPMTGVRLTVETEQARHMERVQRALAYIGAGDIYQVNLAHRLLLEGLGSPWDAYASLRAANPAPYGALLTWADGAVASVSPELFLQVRDGVVLTRPIKGTRPRTGETEADAARKQELLDSAKERAELTMIVDLHRNDLGRVCAFGSVRVEAARRLEAHPTVFHTLADVTGRLRPDRDALDLLEAAFPAGSISGVPKIRALEIIRELEPVARGVYTGAIGVLGLDGNLSLSVAIRTLQLQGTQGALHVGGGIVAESDPAAEYAETLAKAAGILRGLGVQAV